MTWLQNLANIVVHGHDLEQLSESLPFAVSCQELFLPLLSGSRFQEEILRVLNQVWKGAAEALEIPFYRPHDLSLAFDGGVTPRDNSERLENELPRVVRNACTEFVRSGHSAKLTGSNDLFPNWFIPKDVNPVTTLGKPNLSKLCVPITVMLGIPGSSTVAIAKSVCDFSSTANDWVNIVVNARNATGKQDEELYEQYTFRQVERQLTETLEHIRDHVNPLVHPRVMLSVVGYVDPITIAAAIRRVAANSPPVQLKLSLLVACVSATNVYLPDPLEAQNPFPKLFDQLTAGFTTHVVLTHSSEIAASQLGRLRFHIDQANPFADIQCLSQDVFEGPITSLLAVDRFESAYYTSYRDAHFPGWSESESESLGGQWSTKYVSELAMPTMPETLRFEVAPGMERSRFLHLAGATLTPFAVFSKPLKEKTGPETKGIRLAQALAADKVRASTTTTTTTRSGIAAGADSKSSTGAYQSSSGGENEFGWCWGVEGCVVFAREPESVYHYVSTGTCVRMRVESKQKNQSPPQGDDEDEADTKAQAPKLDLQITGMGLNAAKLHDLLLNCYEHVERSIAPLRSKASVSIDEKREVQKRHVSVL